MPERLEHLLGGLAVDGVIQHPDDQFTEPVGRYRTVGDRQPLAIQAPESSPCTQLAACLASPQTSLTRSKYSAMARLAESTPAS